jgi:hypothetical protein
MALFGGAAERLNFVLDLDPSGAIRGFQRVGDEAERNIGRADDRLNRIGGRMQVAGAGMVAFAGIAGRALYGFASASEDANLSELRLQNSIENSPVLAGVSADGFIDLANAIQSKTAADGDQIVAAQAMLATFRLTEDELLRATPLVVDYARKFGVDMVSAAAQVGKAIGGNLGTLQRNGIIIDENAYATDRFGAVMEALRENVGGFAEQEGATFAGSVERLKNQMGDLAEGVGVGVVDAFSGMFDMAGSVSSRLGEMDSRTQAGIGSFAAYATAAIGAVGATSFVAGSVLKMADRFRELDPQTGAATGGLNRFGKAAVGLGIAGVAVGLYQMGTAMNGLTTDVNELTEALEANEEETVRALPAAAHMAGGWEDLADSITSQSVPAAERMLESMIANREEAGISREAIDTVRRAIDDKRTADIQGAADQQAYSAEITAGADATGELTDETDGLTEAQKRAERAAEAHIDALEEQFDAVAQLVPNQLGLETAMIRSARATENYTATMGDAEASDLDKREAAVDLIEAYIAEAEAAGESAAAQAIASGHAAGAQDANVEAQLIALRNLADGLGPGSPVRQQIDGHILALLSIPREQATDIRVNIHPNFGQGTLSLPVAGKFHDGGIVPGPRGSEQLILAQGGEVVSQPGHLPAAAGSTMNVAVYVNAQGATDPYRIGKQITERIAAATGITGTWRPG